MSESSSSPWLVVQQGQAESGQTWELRYLHVDGDTCLQFLVDDAPVDEACGFDIPTSTEIGLSSHLRADHGRNYIFGVTSERIRVVRVEGLDAIDTDARTIPIAGSPLRSFVVVRPPVDDVAAVIGLDAATNELQRIPFPSTG